MPWCWAPMFFSPANVSSRCLASSLGPSPDARRRKLMTTSSIRFGQRSVWLVVAALILTVAVVNQAHGQGDESAVAAGEWVGSETCQSCHRGRFATWHRSFHRSMTQNANAETVLGDFNGEPQEYWGGVITPYKEEGKYYFRYTLPGQDKVLAEYEIIRTVGSHRYQQYLAQTPDTAGTYYRLHLLWHIEEQRWVHMNGAFLGPDSQHFDSQVSVWNQNCIFCHNTGPEPNILNLSQLQLRAAQGKPVDSSRESIFESEVAELGIACETCHGPGAEHVARNRNPLKRLWGQLTGRDDSIIHPDHLSQERSVQVCGQCHGQRVAVDQEEILRWVQNGPSYRAGNDLFASVKLVEPNTQIPGDVTHDRFARRFWNDGVPRLSAYEFQGTLNSACYQDPAFTCSTCHDMHAGDRTGMITEAKRQNGSCHSCHADIAAAAETHTKHVPDSEGSRCVNCHMPRVVYGVMAVHRSHKIEVPDPAAASVAGRPNACNQCHLDQSPLWAAEATQRLWPEFESQVSNQWLRDDGADRTLADGVASLYAGDPVQRALAAEAVGPAILHGGQQAEWWIPHLMAAMTDNYPAVRRFAVNSLQTALEHIPNVEDERLKEAIQDFDFIASNQQRNVSLGQFLRLWNERVKHWPAQQREELLLTPNYLPDERVDDLQALGFKRSGEISIGE